MHADDLCLRILKAELETLRLAAKIVTRGGIIGYPTDTVYGLGCDPFNRLALQKLLEIKLGREKPFPMLAFSKDKVKEIAVWNNSADRVTQKFWPGQLTIVLKLKIKFPQELTGGGSTLAVRVPNNPTTLTLLDLCNGLLVGTSANLSNATPCFTAHEVDRTLGDKVDLIVDGGESLTQTPSTIIDLSNGKFRLIREGSIKSSLLLDVVKGRL